VANLVGALLDGGNHFVFAHSFLLSINLVERSRPRLRGLLLVSYPGQPWPKANSQKPIAKYREAGFSG
jgi:hypothetical protein